MSGQLRGKLNACLFSHVFVLLKTGTELAKMVLEVAKMASTKKVGVWIRVSTEEQAGGESPEHHEKRGRYYAEAKGWEVVEVYNLEAVSGNSVMGQP